VCLLPVTDIIHFCIEKKLENNKNAQQDISHVFKHQLAAKTDSSITKVEDVMLSSQKYHLMDLNELSL
jgi:hypothetical protein